MPNTRLLCLTMALAAPAALAGPATPSARLDQLAWLSGAWIARTERQTVEEHWTVPAGGLMLATGRTVAAGQPTAFEFLRIVERDAGLVYIAQPGGAPPTEFRLVRAGADEAVFENPKHDFPQRLAYRRSGPDALTVRVESLSGEPGFTLSFARDPRKP